MQHHPLQPLAVKCHDVLVGGALPFNRAAAGVVQAGIQLAFIGVESRTNSNQNGGQQSSRQNRQNQRADSRSQSFEDSSHSLYAVTMHSARQGSWLLYDLSLRIKVRREIPSRRAAASCLP